MNSVDKKEPLIRLAPREHMPLGKNILIYLAAILIALVLGGLFIAAVGVNPFSFYSTVITGSFKSPILFSNLIRTIIPLLITALGVSVAFKMRFWNIGAEGQFLMGALMATTVSLLLNGALPSVLNVLIVALAGGLGGAIYGMIVALLKVKFNTNETLLTLMFNYVALYLVQYLVNVDFYRSSANGIPTYKMIPTASWLSEFKIGGFSFDTSLIIALILVVALFLYLRYTKQGYEISVVGDSPNTAKYAGMNVNKIVVRTVFLSAFLVGLAGALQLTGSAASHTLVLNFTSGVGWTAIIVAWLSKLNPFGILTTASLMGLLERGCSIALTEFGVSSASADIIQGIILFTVLALDILIRYRVVIRKKSPEKANEANGIAAKVPSEEKGRAD